MVISLMRQFFDKERIFRITNPDGTNDYRSFNGKELIKKEDVCDALGFAIGSKNKNIEFDIDIVPQKQNAFKREANNQTIITLWKSGFFDPKRLEMSVLALPFIHFDGKDAVISAMSEKIEKMKEEQMKTQTENTQGGKENVKLAGA